MTTRIRPQSAGPLQSGVYIPGCTISSFTFVRQMGKGAFGVVWKVESNQDHKFYCIKIIEAKLLTVAKRKQAIQEALILRRLVHPNIIHYYNTFVEQRRLNIVMECATNGDLDQLIKYKKQRNDKFEEKFIWIFLSKLIDAISYIHSNHIIHRDLKPSNIFLDEKNNPKIGDLGTSKLLQKNENYCTSQTGTPLYLAPEILRSEKYSYPVDIWSLGVVLYYMITFNLPFMSNNTKELEYLIMHKEIKEMPSSYSDNLKRCVNGMLKKNQYDRYNVNDIKLCYPIQIKELFNDPYNSNNNTKTSPTSSKSSANTIIISNINNNNNNNNRIPSPPVHNKVYLHHSTTINVIKQHSRCVKDDNKSDADLISKIDNNNNNNNNNNKISLPPTSKPPLPPPPPQESKDNSEIESIPPSPVKNDSKSEFIRLPPPSFNYFNNRNSNSNLTSKRNTVKSRNTKHSTLSDLYKASGLPKA